MVPLTIDQSLISITLIANGGYLLTTIYQRVAYEVDQFPIVLGDNGKPKPWAYVEHASEQTPLTITGPSQQFPVTIDASSTQEKLQANAFAIFSALTRPLGLANTLHAAMPYQFAATYPNNTDMPAGSPTAISCYVPCAEFTPQTVAKLLSLRRTRSTSPTRLRRVRAYGR